MSYQNTQVGYDQSTAAPAAGGSFKATVYTAFAIAALALIEGVLILVNGEGFMASAIVKVGEGLFSDQDAKDLVATGAFDEDLGIQKTFAFIFIVGAILVGLFGMLISKGKGVGRVLLTIFGVIGLCVWAFHGIMDSTAGVLMAMSLVTALLYLVAIIMSWLPGTSRGIKAAG